jgi:hypothetical protein
MADARRGRIYFEVDGCNHQVIIESMIESIFFDANNKIIFSLVSGNRVTAYKEGCGEEEFDDLLRILKLCDYC